MSLLAGASLANLEAARAGRPRPLALHLARALSFALLQVAALDCNTRTWGCVSARVERFYDADRGAA